MAGLQMAFNDFSSKGYLYLACHFVPPTLTTAYVRPWDISVFQNIPILMSMFCKGTEMKDFTLNGNET
jgi:hypothetical protein